MSVVCTHCGKQWPRDPRLEVPCPTCDAKVGAKCRRPSGHPASEPHVKREERTIQEGHMTRECPDAPDRPEAPVEEEEGAQGRLFDA